MGFEFDDASAAIKEAANAGGSGFTQGGVIRNEKDIIFFQPRARCYRVLAELNGHLCLIDSVKITHFDEFKKELHRLGVTNAIYLDMGAGWNYSWYRNASDEVVTLFACPVPWAHNWIVFRK